MPTPQDEIQFDYYVRFEKENIKTQRWWHMNYNITDDALCYSCKHDPLLPQEWKLELELNTLGGVNDILVRTSTSNGKFDSSENIEAHVELRGGLFVTSSGFDIGMIFVLIFIPFLASMISFFHLSHHREKLTNCFWSKIGMLLTLFVIYSFWMFSLWLLVLSGRMPFDNTLIVISLSIIMMLVIQYVFGHPILLMRYRIPFATNFKYQFYAILAHILIWLAYFPLVVFVLGSFMFNYIWMKPWIYLLFANIGILNICTNILFAKTTNQNPVTTILLSIFIGAIPFTKFGPGLWISGYDLTWVIAYAITQAIIVIIQTLQILFGSRFFLPLRFRVMEFDKYQEHISQSLSINSVGSCNFWTNDLSEPELEYPSSNPMFKRYNSNIYLQPDWGHKFHPNWLMKATKGTGRWPTCGADVGENRICD